MRKFPLLLLALLAITLPARAQLGIPSIQLLNSDNSVAQSFQGAFSIKVGASCTWNVTGSTATFTCSGSGGSPGGSDTQLQFNDLSAFGGADQFTWTKATHKAFLGTALTLPAILSIGNIPTTTDSFLVERVTGDNHFAASIFGQATTTGQSSVGLYTTGIGLGSQGNGTGIQAEGYEGPGMGQSVTQNGAGIYAAHGNYGVGTVAVSAAVRALSTNLNTGIIATSIGVLGQSSTNIGGGTITNAYNFYAQGNSAATNNYAYYSQASPSWLNSPAANSATAANCQGLLCVSGDGYGNFDNENDQSLLDLESNKNSAVLISYRNSELSADHYWASAMNFTNGNYSFYGTANNMAYTGYTMALATKTMLMDDGGGGTTTKISAARYDNLSLCADATGTPACGATSAGAVVIAAAASNVVVATTQVTANSEIKVQEDSSLGSLLSVTCNTTIARVYTVTARMPGTSFTITSSAAPIATPACLTFTVTN